MGRGLSLAVFASLIFSCHRLANTEGRERKREKERERKKEREREGGRKGGMEEWREGGKRGTANPVSISGMLGERTGTTVMPE